MTNVQVVGSTRVTTGGTGPAGVGVPIGGTTGQVLAKASGTNYDTQWVTGGAGGGSTTWVGLTDTAGTITASGIVVGNVGGTALEMVAALAISQVTGLQTALDAKAATGHDLDTHADVAWGSPPDANEILVYDNVAGYWTNSTIGLTGLTDVTYTSLSVGDVLVWTGTGFVGQSLNASYLGTDTLADARVSESNITQHQAALTITESQISDLGAYLTSVSLNGVTDVVLLSPSTDDVLQYSAGAWRNAQLAAADIKSGTFADARVAESNVTQHQAALTIAESQITDSTVLRRFADTVELATYHNPASGTASALAKRMTYPGQVSGVSFSLQASDTGTVTVRVVNDAGTDTSVGTANITSDDSAADASITWTTGTGSFSAGDRLEIEPTSGFSTATWANFTVYGTRSS